MKNRIFDLDNFDSEKFERLVTEDIIAIVNRQCDTYPLDGAYGDMMETLPGRYPNVDPEYLIQQLVWVLDHHRPNVAIEEKDRIVRMRQASVRRQHYLRTIFPRFDEYV